ncbi:hypothetical protein [Flavobacterium sp. DSR2-3-3]|uniref:hypothetical protein n=1 Tax=Flavobacterium sp. DSR2-3-3 TaxID=2804632 RepID=UPI003CFA7015
MDLNQLYSLRRDFTVIGVTGRTGSGCSIVSNILESSIDALKNEIRDVDQIEDKIFQRKYSICKNYIEHKNNWIPFEVIKYKDVLLFYIINRYGGDLNKMKELLSKYYLEKKGDNNKIEVKNILNKIINLNKTEEYRLLVEEIKEFKDFKKSFHEIELEKLNRLFFEPSFKNYANEMFKVLEENGYYKRTLLLHRISCNIRSTGDPIGDDDSDIKNIYSIAFLLNKLIKARKNYNKEIRPTRIVIDSLRNSLEIMFFKERYSAFYMIATKDILNNAEIRVNERLEQKIPNEIEREILVKKLFELDEIEYKTTDFSKGKFSSPDVENCIQKSDYHIFNLKKKQLDLYKITINDNLNGFLTREEQVMKFISLISQPGLITPSSSERNMQMANTAKLNSGCISRKVGAVITDEKFYVKSTGWNDVAKGHTPCNLREVNDFIKSKNNIEDFNNNPHYSEFEKGNVSKLSDFKYKNEVPGNFKEALIDYFDKDYIKNVEHLNGKNCSFCFKTVHNHYEGEANQVHTRSLHAEENAMLQITKLGGQGVENGILFTTASPCELCSKKAYQLGIKKIYYIDPYPGISYDQILNGGKTESRPKMIPFSGAIGNAYHKFYEPFMSYKDEISLTLDLKPKNKLGIQFKNILKKINSPEIEEYINDKNGNISDDDVKRLIIEGLKKI